MHFKFEQISGAKDPRSAEGAFIQWFRDADWREIRQST